MIACPGISCARALRALTWAFQPWLLIFAAPLAVAERSNASLDHVTTVTFTVNHRGGLSLLQRTTHPGSHPGLSRGVEALRPNGSGEVKRRLTPKGAQLASLLASNSSLSHSKSEAKGFPSFVSPDISPMATMADTGNWAEKGVWLSPAFLLLNLRNRVSEAISNVVGGTTTHQQPDYFYRGLSRVGGLLLELHLPAITLEDIHHGHYKSLADFLFKLRSALSSTAGVALEHISILGIHERFQLKARERQTGHSNFVENIGTVDNRELLVRFAVTSQNVSDLDPQAAVDTLRSAIRDQTSALMTGPLGEALHNSTITLSLSSDLAMMPLAQRKETATQISAMALPIGISAAFTGILVWLAAF